MSLLNETSPPSHIRTIQLLKPYPFYQTSLTDTRQAALDCMAWHGTDRFALWPQFELSCRPWYPAGFNAHHLVSNTLVYAHEHKTPGAPLSSALLASGHGVLNEPLDATQPARVHRRAPPSRRPLVTTLVLT